MTEETQPTDFDDSPEGQARRWKVELDAAKKFSEEWRAQGVQVDKIFLDERETKHQHLTKWNLFTSDILTLKAMLYGNPPKANVSRRFADAEDDAARVAGEMLERILHSDLEKRSDTAAEAFGDALMDDLIPGCGQVRVRYEVEFETKAATPAILDEATGMESAPAVPAQEVKGKEDACIDYVHWQDFLWSPAKVWSQVTWVDFISDMGKEAFEKRFPEGEWEKVPKSSTKEKDEDKAKDPWARARVHEIWHKDSKKVFWYVDGHSKVLDSKDDPLGLDGFWPCPKPMLANTTTTKLLPRPDYVLAQDLYSSINTRATRIKTLESAIKAVGVYDGANVSLKRVLTEACQNEMLPVDNWALFAEKGGLKGAVDFVPLDQTVAALGVLRDLQREDIDMLYQVTGRADIMRGQASSAGVSATEQSIKAKFGSVRVQRRQDEFARFVSEAQALKAEVICKHFEPQSILERSNAQFAFKDDQQHVPKAIELLKSQHYCYRVEVKPESISLTDFAQLKQDRTEVVGAISAFITSAAPLMQAMPSSTPFLLKLLQNVLAGLKGSSTMEGTLDAAIQAAEAAEEERKANPQQGQQDPKLQTQQLKNQGDQMKIQADMRKQDVKHQQDLEKIAAETQAHDQQEQSQALWNVREAAQKQIVANTLKPPDTVKPGGAK